MFSALSNTKGFTLIELMVVVSIISVIAAFAVPTFGNSLDSNAVRQEALNLASDIELVKTKALSGAYSGGTTSANWGIILCSSSNNGKYTLSAFDSSNAALSGSSEKDIQNGVLINSGCGTVIFARLSGIPIGLASNRVVSLSKNGITRTVTINATTGKIAVQ
jgi:prepilin-type N-terminal cleavage/methylation domain-containing protein